MTLANNLDPFSLPIEKEVCDTLRTSKNNQGIFQLGNSVTTKFCNKYKRIDNEHQIIALIALIRPSCMQARLDDGKTIAEHYVARANGEEDITYLHPKLESITGQNFGLALFQEDNIRMTSDLAGFDLVEADLMRQAIGKKDFVKLESLREKFINGCLTHSGISEDIATQLFEQIRASGRYQFNKCIAGYETIFGSPLDATGKRMLTIEEMYKIKNDSQYAKENGYTDLHVKYNEVGYGIGYSQSNFLSSFTISVQFQEADRVKLNRIVDIRYAGYQRVYRITTVDGQTIDVTGNHKFPTHGAKFKQADQLEITDRIPVRIDWNNDLVRYVYIKSVEATLHAVDVYDVEMSPDVSHTFMILNGIITCNSHSTSYGMLGYIDLWIRYHHPHLFYATKIAYAEINTSDKQKKINLIKDLISSAKERNINIYLPDLVRRNVHADFDIKQNCVYFGFNNVTGIGASSFQKIFDKITAIEEKRGKHLLEHSWLEILLYFSQAIGKVALECFITLGMFSHLSSNRRGMLYDFNDWLQIQTNAVSAKWFENNAKNTFAETLKSFSEAPVGKNGGLSNDEQKKKAQTIYNLSLTNRPSETSSEWILRQEKTLLGTIITKTIVFDEKADQANLKLNEIGPAATDQIIAVNCMDIDIRRQKNGKEFAVIRVIDEDNNEADIFVFADTLKKYSELIYPQASLLIYGDVSERGSFVAKKIEEIDCFETVSHSPTYKIPVMPTKAKKEPQAENKIICRTCQWSMESGVVGKSESICVCDERFAEDRSILPTDNSCFYYMEKE